MKKYMIGFVAGALFMIAGQSFAGTTTLIGKKVDSEIAVKVDGQVIDKAIVIQGKSFVPVRNIATAMGGEVSAVGKGGIELKTGIDLSNVEDKEYKLKVLNTAKEALVKEQNVFIAVLPEHQGELKKAEEGMELSKSKNYTDEYAIRQADIDRAIELINATNAKIAELQAKIDAINTQIAEVEAQP